MSSAKLAPMGMYGMHMYENAAPALMGGTLAGGIMGSTLGAFVGISYNITGFEYLIMAGVECGALAGFTAASIDVSLNQ